MKFDSYSSDTGGEHASKAAILVLAGGMPRSGSTWLYNAVRLVLRGSPEIAKDLTCMWRGEWGKCQKTPYMLVKMHNCEKILVGPATTIVYSYRDIRDAVASMHRKFGATPTKESIDHIIRQHRLWMRVANVLMRYESMLEDKATIINQLIRLFDIKNVKATSVINAIGNMSYESEGEKNDTYHKENLFHKGHITDGRHGSWEGILDLQIIRYIEENYGNWLTENGYPACSHKNYDSIQQNHHENSCIEKRYDVFR